MYLKFSIIISGVCIAQYESTFNTAAVNDRNWDGSKDYGLFQLSNKYWCDDEYEKNECRTSCQGNDFIFFFQ